MNFNLRIYQIFILCVLYDGQIKIFGVRLISFDLSRLSRVRMLIYSIFFFKDLFPSASRANVSYTYYIDERVSINFGLMVLDGDIGKRAEPKSLAELNYFTKVRNYAT
jgi:hypothetical protein